MRSSLGLSDLVLKFFDVFSLLFDFKVTTQFAVLFLPNEFDDFTFILLGRFFAFRSSLGIELLPLQCIVIHVLPFFCKHDIKQVESLYLSLAIHLTTYHFFCRVLFIFDSVTSTLPRNPLPHFVGQSDEDRVHSCGELFKRKGVWRNFLQQKFRTAQEYRNGVNFRATGGGDPGLFCFCFFSCKTLLL